MGLGSPIGPERQALFEDLRRDRPQKICSLMEDRVLTSWAYAAQEETVTFRFETILIKYCRQAVSGEHGRVKIKGFNRSHPELDVAELDPIQLQQEVY